MLINGSGTDAFASISTPQLELVAMRPVCLRSELEGDGRLGELLGCEVTQQWPPEVWEPHVWELLSGHFAEYPEDVTWHRYLLLRDDGGRGRVLVGTVNAFRWPDRRDEAEIGYALVPEFWRLGLASEAAEAMVAWIAATRQVRSLFAHTFPELTASVRILERCGFVPDGPGAEERTVRYRRELRLDG